MTRPAAGYESHEYARLVERNFQPYSMGHRMMYTKAIALTRDRFMGGARILEAGFGIGWGLNAMCEAGIVREYVGYEPNEDSYAYVQAQVKAGKIRPPDRHVLLPLTFEPNLDPTFDVAFCIEVIEHVPLDQQVDFLRGLRSMAPYLALSTPDKDKAPTEGVRTTLEWVDLLTKAGFQRVTVDVSQWTHFFWCER